MKRFSYGPLALSVSFRVFLSGFSVKASSFLGLSTNDGFDALLNYVGNSERVFSSEIMLF